MAWDDGYVTESGAGGQTGADVANAWAFVADFAAIKSHLAGSNDRILLCYEGTPWTPGQAMTWDHTSGTSTAFNAIVGANSSGVVDGTQVVIDGGAGAYSGFLSQSNFLFYEYITLQNYNGTAAWQFSTNGKAVKVNLKNCKGNTSKRGLYCPSFQEAVVSGCQFNNNTVTGLDQPDVLSLIYGCEIIGNSGDGIGAGSGINILFSVIADNGSDGIYALSDTFLIAHNIIENNSAHGILMDANSRFVAFNKITNNGGYGIKYNDSAVDVAYLDHNAFFNNTSGEIDYNGAGSEGRGTNNISMTEDFYNAPATNDYTTVPSDESVGNAFTIGLSPTNVGYLSNQFPPIYPTTTAPTGGAITKLEAQGNGRFKVTIGAVTGSTQGTYIYVKSSATVFTGGAIAATIPATWTTFEFNLSAEGTQILDGVTWYIGTRPFNGTGIGTNTDELFTRTYGAANTIQIKQAAGS